MNYSGIKLTDMINGEGIRTSLFVSGCSHHCVGCFNKDTWDENYGEVFDEKVENEIFNHIEKNKEVIRGLSILGGDSTYYKNIQPLIDFCKKFKSRFPNKTIWIWSGYVWEIIMQDVKMKELISLCDVLIDGRFVIGKKNLNLKWRGSSNQRVINISESLKNKRVILLEK